MTLPLSVLDLSPLPSGSTGPQALTNTLDLARLADDLGYHRYWLAEHHTLPSVVSPAPEIMIGQVARETKRIRVGSGGVMLPNHSPLKVAEWFHTLEALFPGRIDLGIGRAPGTDQVTARALRGMRASLGGEDFPSQLGDLFRFSTGEWPEGHPFRSVRAVPTDVTLPPVWLLGSSGYSARLSAKLGLGFAFAHHFSSHDVMDAMHAYREGFTPSEYLAKPHAMLTVSVICAETEERAEHLAATVDLMWLQLVTGQLRALPSPEEALAYPYTPSERAQLQARRALHFIGTPDRVKAEIMELAEQTSADEVMIASSIHSHAERRRSYELLAEAFKLKA